MSYKECCHHEELDGLSDSLDLCDELTSFVVSQMGANKKLPKAIVLQPYVDHDDSLCYPRHEERHAVGRRHIDGSSSARNNQDSGPETIEINLKVDKCAEDHGTAMASLMSDLKLPLEAIEIRHSIPEAPQQDDVQSWGDSRRTRDCCYRRRRRVKAANEDRDAVGPETRARSITYTEQVTEIKISRVEQSWTLA